MAAGGAGGGVEGCRSGEVRAGERKGCAAVGREGEDLAAYGQCPEREDGLAGIPRTTLGGTARACLIVELGRVHLPDFHRETVLHLHFGAPAQALDI